MPAWAGGQGPRDRARSRAEAKARPWEWMSSRRRECGVREEVVAKGRALGSAHSWRGAGAGREGVQRKGGGPLSPPSFPVPPCLHVQKPGKQG